MGNQRNGQSHLKTTAQVSTKPSKTVGRPKKNAPHSLSGEATQHKRVKKPSAKMSAILEVEEADDDENDDEEAEASFYDVAHSTLRVLEKDHGEDQDISTAAGLADELPDEEITPPPDLPPPYQITFEVPCGKYSRDLSAKSIWTWSLFVDNVARIMDCHSSSLVLGYVLPWKVKSNQKATPKILDDADAFEKLKADTQIWCTEQIAKKKPSKKSGPATSVHTENRDAVAAAVRDAKLNSIIQEINSRHHCNEHKIADYVRSDGTHEPFTIAQIAQWAELITRNFEGVGIEKPPAQLKLYDHVPKCKRTNSLSSEPVMATPNPPLPTLIPAPPTPVIAMQTQVAGASVPVQAMPQTVGLPQATMAMQPNMAVSGMPLPLQQTMPNLNFNPFMLPQLGAFGFPSPYMPFQIPPGYQLLPLNQSAPPQTQDTDGFRYCPFSNDQLVANLAGNELLVLYPDSKAWLEFCDRDFVGGRDGENYAQYVDALIGKWLLRLDDFVELQAADLLQICTRMEIGTGRRILHFAHKDIQKLKKGQKLHI